MRFIRVERQRLNSAFLQKMIRRDESLQAFFKLLFKTEKCDSFKGRNSALLLPDMGYNTNIARKYFLQKGWCSYVET